MWDIIRQYNKQANRTIQILKIIIANLPLGIFLMSIIIYVVVYSCDMSDSHEIENDARDSSFYSVDCRQNSNHMKNY